MALAPCARHRVSTEGNNPAVSLRLTNWASAAAVHASTKLLFKASRFIKTFDLFVLAAASDLFISQSKLRLKQHIWQTTCGGEVPCQQYANAFNSLTTNASVKLRLHHPLLLQRGANKLQVSPTRVQHEARWVYTDLTQNPSSEFILLIPH